MTGGSELELKLIVDPGDAARLLGFPLFAGATTQPQRTVYFDTPDHTLRDAGLSLRIRHADGKAIQTLKVDGGASAGLFVRPEWEMEVPGDMPVIAGALLPAPFLARFDPAALAPAFVLEIERTAILRDTAESRVELVLDRGTVTAGDRRDPVCEVELELEAGDAGALFALAREIDALVPARLGALSKSERGHRLLRGRAERPAKADAVALEPGFTATQSFRAVARSCLRQFRLNEDLLARAGDAAALHQARVALRRLRSAFITFKALLAGEETERFRADLRWLSGELGHARNLDVLIERIEDDALRTRLTDQRTAAYAVVADALRSKRVRALFIDLAEWLTSGGWTAAAGDAAVQPAAAHAVHALDRFRRRLRRAGRGLAKLSDEDRHDVRIAAKKLRYAAGFFGTLFPGAKAERRRKAFLAALDDLQGDLGHLNDLATAPEVLAAAGLPAEAIGAAAPGLQDRKRLLKEAEAQMDALLDLKRFWR